MANVNIRPLGDRVLVHPLEEQEVKKGGIIIPDTAKEKPQEGKVVQVGPGKRDDAGKLSRWKLKKGTRSCLVNTAGQKLPSKARKC